MSEIQEASKFSFKGLIWTKPTTAFLWQTWGGFSCLVGPTIYPIIQGLQDSTNVWVTHVLPIVILPCYAFWLGVALTASIRYFMLRKQNS